MLRFPTHLGHGIEVEPAPILPVVHLSAPVVPECGEAHAIGIGGATTIRPTFAVFLAPEPAWVSPERELVGRLACHHDDECAPFGVSGERVDSQKSGVVRKPVAERIVEKA